MQMEPQVSLDCTTCFHSNSIFHKEGASDVNAMSIVQDHVSHQQPAKRQKRQWAAWTRQEEESFFNALRQFGKNFENITARVQSKNKDQVRHYYYRLVRRMNKLLGPEVCLDARNSKDTNAAMLRWWSLLEKYSCKASKLHLKPRRFKTFLDTLGNQLLKDRRKNKRKRRVSGEIFPASASASAHSQGKVSCNDNRLVKVVVRDSQNIQKSGSGKASSLKRNANIGVNRGNCKGDLFSLKTARLRRKPAAYKRWEKAAIAGVSLVADAAAHLERTDTDEVVELVKGTRGETVRGPVEKVVCNVFGENGVQDSAKLKLQLFPIDDITRRALEMDNHNPYLELTLSTRKKISSVVEHLSRKWGNSSIACGQLGLLPYCIQKENLVNCRRWTQDSFLSAADVYAQIGRPLVFRLRYCWFSNADHEAATFQEPLASLSILDEHRTNINTELRNVDLLPCFTPSPEHGSDKLNDHLQDQLVSVGKSTEVEPASGVVHTDMVERFDTAPSKNILDSSDNQPNTYGQRETSNVPLMIQVKGKDDMKFNNESVFLRGEWADSLTNISMGDLLSEVPDNIDASCVSPSLPGTSHSIPQIPFSCDSFDAAIASLVDKNGDKPGFQPCIDSCAPSIWEAEETCDAFSFQKNSFCTDMGSTMDSSLKACEQSNTLRLAASGSAVQEIPDMEDPINDDHDRTVPVNQCQSDPHTIDVCLEDPTGLSDLYWSESLGPLDLGIPSCKYHNEELILSDSLSGLNRLLASSLDAFETFSVFGVDKIVSDSTVEAREGVSFLDYEIGSKA